MLSSPNFFFRDHDVLPESIRNKIYRRAIRLSALGFWGFGVLLDEFCVSEV